MRRLVLSLLMMQPLFACSDSLESASVETYFCQHGGCTDRVIGLCSEAEDTLWAAVYAFTELDLATALVDAHNRGVEVLVLNESSQMQNNSSERILSTLTDAGVDVRLDGNSSAMHHKFVIVDARVVATGSFNWTRNAEFQNDENLVVLHSDQIAYEFGLEFSRVWDEGRSVEASP